MGHSENKVGFREDVADKTKQIELSELESGGKIEAEHGGRREEMGICGCERNRRG
jgi:hypothetical protein